MRYNVAFTNGKQYQNVTINRIKKLFNPSNQWSATITNSGLHYMTVNVLITLGLIVVSQDYGTNSAKLAIYDKTTKEAKFFSQSPSQLSLTTAVLEAHINQL